jgi:poly(hydroxyalkanoate) granule-associated protein
MPLPSHLKDSAQQIWLAGLGAFSKVQAEGGKVFDTLVNDGLNLQRKTQALAEERIQEASSRLSLLGSDLSSKAAGSMDKLENIFEDRVARALHRLGIPSAQDMAALQARIDALQREVQRLSAPAKAQTPAVRRRASAAGTTAASPPATRKTAVRNRPTRKNAAPRS